MFFSNSEKKLSIQIEMIKTKERIDRQKRIMSMLVRFKKKIRQINVDSKPTFFLLKAF